MVEIEQRAAVSLERRTPWRDALETMLRELSPDRADAWMMRLNEGRGTFALTLASTSGRALLIGHPLSGTAIALEQLGLRVVCLGACALDLRLANGRRQTLLGRGGAGVVGLAGQLPFRDGTFDLVVHEGGPEQGWRALLPELIRVAHPTRGELVLIGDNPLAYKRALGRRGRFVHATPWSFAGRVLRPPAAEARATTLRRLLRSAQFSPVRAYALYPHALEFSHVVGLDGDGPDLTIGRRERQNRVKLFGHRVGLFETLAPSFCVHGKRGGARSRLGRILGGLAERTGLRPGRVEHLVATRSTTALVLTDGPDPICLHVPLSPSKRNLTETHMRFLRLVEEHFPTIPVPTPLFAGEIDGTWIQAERRLGGLTAPHLTGTDLAEDELPVRVAEVLSHLKVSEPAPLTQGVFDELLGERCAEVQRRSGSVGTAKALGRMLAEAAERLVGRELPLMLYHADTRAKHVQVDHQGRVIGLLDWGASESKFLPYADLGHLLVHQRKQTHGGTVGAAWRVLRRPDARSAGEQEALLRYGDALQIETDVQEAMIDIIPLIVAGMAERNWDYSRPAWVGRQFEI